MKPAGYMLLTALLFVSMCTTMQRKSAIDWEQGYVPAGQVEESS